MYVDNITSDAMVLNYNGKALQIKVYEDLLKEKDKEIERLENIIKEVREEIEKLANLYDDNYTITDKAKDILEILEKEVN